jgi:hypothetical protein
VQRCHWKEKETGDVPVQVPVAAVSAPPTVAEPETEGAVVELGMTAEEGCLAFGEGAVVAVVVVLVVVVVVVVATVVVGETEPLVAASAP